MKKILTAGFAVVSFLAGVLVIFTKKSQAPFKTALTLEVTPDQINDLSAHGGAVLFKDINVKGQIAVQLKQDQPTQ